MTRAFGWLDATHAFRTGECPGAVLLALETAARSMTDRSRGWHLCEICGNRTYGPTPYETSTVGPLELGSAVIEVRNGDSEVWQAPDLVLHYIAVHGYLPPDEVIEICAGA